MQLLCFIDNLGSGGAQRQLVTLGILFRKYGHNVSFLTYHADDFFLEKLSAHGISVKCIPVLNYFKRIQVLRGLLRTGKQDVVLSFLDTPNLIAEIAAMPRRSWGLVVGERSANLVGMTSRRGKCQRQMHRIADAVVTNSFAAREVLAANWPAIRDKLHTIYNSVNIEQFYPDESVLPKENNIVRMVVAASYQRLKNMQGLIQAIAQLSTVERAMLRVDWYGQKNVSDGTTREFTAAQEEIAENNLQQVITLHDETDDIVTVMQQADVVGLFSFYEGLPNAVCEGMACGKAIFMSEVSDANYLVTPLENGWLCNPHDVYSIACGLRQMINTNADGLQRMGNMSRKMAIELFAPEKKYQQYYEIMQQAMKQHAREKN